MARSGRTLEREGDGADADRRVEAGREDVLDAGSPDEVDTLVRADREIADLVAGVALEVGRAAELAGIDEDRGGHGRVLGARPGDERAVPGVEPAHRGHQPR